MPIGLVILLSICIGLFAFLIGYLLGSSKGGGKDNLF